MVAALLNTPADLDGVNTEDPEAVTAAQAEPVLQTLPTVIERRHTIVNAAGRDSGWTAGVDYTALLRASAPTGELQVPLLATPTTVDLLAPVEFQEEYAEMIRRAGKRSLFRQAIVDRTGHCRLAGFSKK